MVLGLTRYVGKAAIVTGASSGIGAAIAETLVKNGLNVAGLARRVERVEELSKKLGGEKGKLYPFKCDMAKEQEIVTTFRMITHKMGEIHVLINNAGVMEATDLINGDTQKWKITIDTNILGLCIATREALQDMIAKGTKGHIIHMNSVIGHTTTKEYTGINVYGATKHAITALAETLRFELNGKKLPVKVTSISPGYVKSELLQSEGLKEQPYRPIYPSDVAHAVVYALSTPLHVNVTEITIQGVGS